MTHKHISIPDRWLSKTDLSDDTVIQAIAQQRAWIEEHGLKGVHQLVYQKQYTQLETALRKFPLLVWSQDRFLRTPLHYAALNNDIYGITLLLGYQEQEKQTPFLLDNQLLVSAQHYIDVRDVPDHLGNLPQDCLYWNSIGIKPKQFLIHRLAPQQTLHTGVR